MLADSVVRANVHGMTRYHLPKVMTLQTAPLLQQYNAHIASSMKFLLSRSVRVSMGHVPGIVHVPRKVVGEVDVADGTETFVFTGRMEDYPQSGVVPFGNVAYKGMIVMIDQIPTEPSTPTASVAASLPQE